MQRSLLSACLLLFSLSSFAQDFRPGVTFDELDLKTYSKDSTANAVVLNEFGTAYITNDEKN